MEILRKLSNRELQAYGALCLQRFCSEKHIKHPYINELLEHLLTMLTSSDLVAWDRKLADLELSGAGDPLPAEIEILIIADDTRNDFHLLVEFTVEIGIGDMFAKPSERPLKHLFRCLKILDANGIAPPDVPELFRNKMRIDGVAPYRGEAYSQKDYEQVKSLFLYHI